MNTLHTPNSITFNRNDLVLIIGESMGKNCSGSIRFAHELARGGEFGNVLFINTVQRRKKLTRTIHETLGAEFDTTESAKSGLHFMSRTEGDLGYDTNTIHGLVADEGVRTIVVNAWEMAAGSCRKREQLLFQVQQWLCELDLTVVIFAEHSRAVPKAGYIHRGGFGRLAGIADVVIEAYASDADASAVAEREPVVVPPEPVAAAQATVNANGSRELYMESSVEIEDGDAIIQKWDALEIPRSEPRIYFQTDPHTDSGASATLVEERFSRGRILMRTISVSRAEYDFPTPAPREERPEVGVELEEYLDAYRKENPVRVHNDVGDFQGVTDQISMAGRMARG